MTWPSDSISVMSLIKNHVVAKDEILHSKWTSLVSQTLSFQAYEKYGLLKAIMMMHRIMKQFIHNQLTQEVVRAPLSNGGADCDPIHQVCKGEIGREREVCTHSNI